MKQKDYLILAINLGSTSTKVALFRDDTELVRKEIHISPEELERFNGFDENIRFRGECVVDFLSENDISPKELDMIATRGVAIPHIRGGAIKVTPYILNYARYAAQVKHAAGFASSVGYNIAKPYGTPVIFYDTGTVDELCEDAKVTGLPEVVISPLNHVLNIRKVGRIVSERIGKRYEDSNLIIVHMGGGVGISAHMHGKIVDCLSTDMGPMSPERAGYIPTRYMVELCYGGKYSKAEMEKKLDGRGGIMAYLGTQDMKKVSELVDDGDENAIRIVHAMAYQTAKGIGQMAAALKGEVDRVIYTGGLARFEQFCAWVKEYSGYIAPLETVQGEYEMVALAEGALRVLRGEEEAFEYTTPPEGYASVEEFMEEAMRRTAQEGKNE